MGQVIGYARVSSSGQSLAIQLEKLTAHGCTKIYQEKKSGTKDDRPELKACLEYLREGDTLVITMLDRMARSTNHLTSIAEKLRERGVELVVLGQNIDTSNPTGRLLFNILATIAEFETEIRKERQLSGIEKAKRQGVKFGAKAKLTAEQVEEMKQRREAGELVNNLMTEFGISKATFYRLIGADKEKASHSRGHYTTELDLSDNQPIGA